METKKSEVHPFTQAGLGEAPFRVVGHAERTFQAVPGAPVKAGGCCKFCYTGIRYAVIVRSADGNVFDVGSECVRKVDHAAWKEYRELRRTELRETRTRAQREAYALAQAARLAEEERRARENEAAFRAHEPALARMVDALLPLDGEYAGQFAARALRSVQTSGQVADREDLHHTTWKLTELFYEHTASGHVGTVGKRETFEARYVGRFSFDTHFGPKTIYKLAVERADGTHALVTWKTSSYLTAESSTPLPIGSRVLVTASVKEHGEYRGKPQTEIQRPKFKLV